MATDPQPALSLRELLADRDLVLFLATRLIASLTRRMVLIAFGWQLYDMTRSPLSLGYGGLASLVPALVLLLPSGAVADRFDRRRVVSSSFVLSAVAAGTFALLSHVGVSHSVLYYAALVGSAAAFALYRPSGASMLATLVPRERFPAALGLAQSALLTGTIAGPAVGGLLYAWRPEAVYLAACACNLAGAAATASLRAGAGPRKLREGTSSWQLLSGGFVYVWKRNILLGVISLDLFSSIVGGVTALLPIFARDILVVGPRGLGFLRSAPAIGGIVASVAMARTPVRRRGGLLMFATVFLSGFATIGFGLSRSFALSILALACMGAMDLVSSNIRQTLVQLATPDDMRGRVVAVQQMSNSTSSDLGDFLSGISADLWGASRAVTYGGIAAIAVGAAWMRAFPGLRDVQALDVERS